MRRLFILGIDGATFDVLKPWVADGHLPNFARLFDEGCHSVMQSSTPPLSPVAWTSIATGVNPGKHGIYDFITGSRAEGADLPTFNFATGRNRKTKAFWEIFTELDRPSIVVNMPASYPPDPVNGLMISGWDATQNISKAFYPRELHEEIVAECGAYYMTPLDLISKATMLRTDPASLKKLGDATIKSAQQRRRVTRYLATKHPWDVFFGVFTETDIAQHRFWDSVDSTDLESNVIFQVYREVDLFVGDLFSEFGDDIDIMVVSDHGFRSMSAAVDLDLYLQQQGFLHRNSSASSSLRTTVLRCARFLRPIIKRLRPASSKNRPAVKPRHATIERDKSRVFFEGKYPYFYVLPPNKAEDLLPELQNSLMSLCYGDDPVFKKVVQSDEVFWGPYAKDMPDVVGIINEQFSVSGAGILMAQPQKKGVFGDHMWNGIHAPNGIFMFRGKAVEQGQFDTINVFDVTPTILARCGIPIPNEMDGKPIPAVLSSQEPQYSDYNIYKDPSVTVTDISDDDESELRNRLDALGYL